MRYAWLWWALALPAHAADWVGVTIPHSEDQYFYDRSKLVINSPEVTYWKKVVFKQAQKVKDRLAVSGLMRERIHCTEHSLRLLSFLYHDANGAVIDYVTEAEKEGVPIIPDTVGDVFEQTLCALTKPGPSPTSPLSPTMGRQFLHRIPSPALPRTPPTRKEYAGGFPAATQRPFRSPLAGEGLGERADLSRPARHV